MEENIKNDNKVLIIIIVVLSLLLIGLSSYIVYDKLIAKNDTEEKESNNSNNNNNSDSNNDNNEENSSNDKNNCTPDPESGKYCISDKLSTTSNWFEFDFLDENVEYSFILPDGYILNGSILTDKDNKKIGELNPVIKLSDGQKMPTKLSDLTNQNDERVTKYFSEIYDSEFYTQDDFQIFLTHSKVESCGFEEGEYCQYWYPHSFYINKDNIVFGITFYTMDKNLSKELLNTYKKVAVSFKLY